jgi:hypothetical protein
MSVWNVLCFDLLLWAACNITEKWKWFKFELFSRFLSPGLFIVGKDVSDYGRQFLRNKLQIKCNIPKPLKCNISESGNSQRQQKHLLQALPEPLSLWGASCFVTYIYYINIQHKTIHMWSANTNNNFFTLPKPHYMIRILRAIFRWYFLRFSLYCNTSIIFTSMRLSIL